jgi:hypothetical protein
LQAVVSHIAINQTDCYSDSFY